MSIENKFDWIDFYSDNNRKIIEALLDDKTTTFEKIYEIFYYQNKSYPKNSYQKNIKFTIPEIQSADDLAQKANNIFFAEHTLNIVYVPTKEKAIKNRLMYLMSGAMPSIVLAGIKDYSVDALALQLKSDRKKTTSDKKYLLILTGKGKWLFIYQNNDALYKEIELNKKINDHNKVIELLTDINKENIKIKNEDITYKEKLLNHLIPIRPDCLIGQWLISYSYFGEIVTLDVTHDLKSINSPNELKDHLIKICKETNTDANKKINSEDMLRILIKQDTLPFELYRLPRIKDRKINDDCYHEHYNILKETIKSHNNTDRQIAINTIIKGTNNYIDDIPITLTYSELKKRWYKTFRLAESHILSACRKNELAAYIKVSPTCIYYKYEHGAWDHHRLSNCGNYSYLKRYANLARLKPENHSFYDFDVSSMDSSGAISIKNLKSSISKRLKKITEMNPLDSTDMETKLCIYAFLKIDEYVNTTGKDEIKINDLLFVEDEIIQYEKKHPEIFKNEKTVQSEQDQKDLELGRNNRECRTKYAKIRGEEISAESAKKFEPYKKIAMELLNKNRDTSWSWQQLARSVIRKFKNENTSVKPYSEHTLRVRLSKDDDIKLSGCKAILN